MVDGEHPRAARAGRVPGEPLLDYEPPTIGPYTLLSRLGAGGMGTVYLGEDRSGRRVAVKVVRPDLASNAEFRRRFRAEMTAARRVAPFCTAEVLDTDSGARLPYMVTEFIDGVRLDHEVSANGPLSASTLTGTAVGVATALTAIHRAGLVHRDLKPSNVILSLSGPRVIDFGIAQALDGTVAQPTRWGFGSSGWMAPEQVNGQPIGPAADVFVWGILVAYAGTGRHPFGEGTDVEVTHRIVNAQPDLHGLPPAIHELVAMALAKQADARPTARELLLRLVEREHGSDSTSLGKDEEALEIAGQADAAARAVSHTRVSSPSFVTPLPAAVPRPRDVPGPAAPPGGRQRRGSRGTVVALSLLALLTVVAIVLVAMTAGGDAPDSATAPSTAPPATPPPSPSAAPTPDAEPRDGQLAFTVTSAKCGESRSGIIFAGSGKELCVIDVTVRNVGTSARFFHNDQQYLVDGGGGRHQASQLDLNPGQFLPLARDASTERTLVFEIPDDAEPSHLELQDSDDDGGVVVSVQVG